MGVIRKLCVGSVLLAVTAGTVAADGASRTFHIDEIVSATAARYPGLRVDDAKIKAARARLNEARLSPFFQFNTDVVFSVRPGARGTPTFSPDSQVPLSNRWGPTGGIRLEGALPIYTFGKIRGAKEAARSQVAAARSGRQQTLAEVIFDVRRAYYGAQLALDLQMMIEEGQNKLQRAIDRLEERLEEDDPDVHEFDEWRLESALAQINGRGSNAIKLEHASKAALQILSGIDALDVPECPLALVHNSVFSLEEHLAHAQASRPELDQLAAGQKGLKAIEKVRRGGYFPDILLGLSAAYQKTGVVTDIDNPFVQDRANFRQFAFGLVARWSLDFAGNVHRVKRAKAEVEMLKAQAEQAWDGIAFEVTQAYEELESAERSEKAWRRGQKETRSWFVAAAQGYEVGTTSAKNLVEAITQYFSARFEHLESIAAYNIALADLERVTGVPLVDPLGWRHGCEE